MGDDFTVTADWGHFGLRAGAVNSRPRAASSSELIQKRNAPLLAICTSCTRRDEPSMFTLNERALWRCVPAAVWNYKLGGYQVLKKWLSYREQ